MSDQESGMFSCRNICWIAGGLLGLAAFLLLKNALLLALIVGIALAVAVALLLRRLFCISEEDVVAPAATATASASTPAPAAPAAAPAAATTAEPEAEAPKAKAPADTVTDTGAAKDKAPAPKAKAAANSDKPATAPKAKPAKATADSAKASAAKAPARAPVAKDGKPDLLDAPRGGSGDDLKQLKGVGPKLEEKLNALGVWHFDQIAGWRKKEIEWVDDQLSFKGRIERDDWIKQAKILAKGGETEFSSKVKKGGVY